MKHFSADPLRDYKFGLLSESAAAEMAAHLETCAACRQKLQALDAQFQALEVLREQPEVSEERLEAVLAESRKVGRSKIVPFRTAALLAAAAGFAIYFMLFRPAVPLPSRTAEAGSAIPPTATLAELRAAQPFAPASNIELNVLSLRDEVQLTIYNAEDLTLVREKRKLTLKRGWNWLQFMWSNTLIDPTSLELRPVTHAGQIEITQLVYPPRLNELARWTIFSEHSGEAEFELTYFTSGLIWNAFYEATLAPDEQSMHLKSYVRIDNSSGEDYENAQTRLVVGLVRLEEPISKMANNPAYQDMEKLKLVLPKPLFSGTPKSVRINIEPEEMERGATRKEITKQALSEYQLYTIEGHETIPDGWGKRLPNIEAQEIGITNLYKFEQERWGGQTMHFLSFANTEAHHLGETPLPQGRVRVFKNVDEASNLVYIGVADIQYIPVGEKVELELGVADKVKVEPKLMRTRTDNFEFDQKGNIAGWDEITNWIIELTNTRDLPVEIEAMRWANSNHWKIETDAAVEKYDASHFRFIEKVEARGKRIIEYELTVHHGTRTEKQ